MTRQPSSPTDRGGGSPDSGPVDFATLELHGCVPVDSDVDCAGGSGNGPSYVDGPVQVVGSDPYGLDADSGGVGCE